MRPFTKNKKRHYSLSERQVTRKGSKLDIQQLEGDELKKVLEEKLGIELQWSDYSWEAKGEYAGCTIILDFIENDRGNSYSLSYFKEGSIHDRSVWEADSMLEFEKDVDEMIAELKDYSNESESVSENEAEFENEGETELDLDSDVEPEFEESWNRRGLRESQNVGILKGYKDARDIVKDFGHLTLTEFFDKLNLSKLQQRSYHYYDPTVDDMSITLIRNVDPYSLAEFLSDNSVW